MTAPLLAVGVKKAAELVDTSEDTILRAIHATEPPYLRARRIGTKFSIAVKDLVAWHESLPEG